jgi:hypothetical protein
MALGKIAQEKLLSINGDVSGDYVLLSGIYSSYGEWSRVETVRRSMDKRGLRKVVGCAQIGHKTAGLSAL